MALSDLMSGYGIHKFPMPPIAGAYKGKTLAICGDARCLWDDLEALGCRSDLGRGTVRRDGFDFMTVNKVVETFPGNIEHAYSNEPKLLMKFIAARRNEYSREFEHVQHTHSCNEGAKWRWPWGGQGTSGLGATLVGVGLGYDRIILCGLPLDNTAHNGEPHWRRCHFETSEAASPRDSEAPNGHWKRAIDLAFEGRVKSMSGRTREWLGAP